MLSTGIGNVLAIVSDRLFSTETYSGSGIVDHYSADIVSSNDYYPGVYTERSRSGMQMPGRTFSSNQYRYGFNGQEKDPEGMGGGGTTYDYGFRIYNPQIAKFLSVDPLTSSYPWYTPYQFAGNKPIWAIDLDGLEEYFYLLLRTEKEGKSNFIKVPYKVVTERYNSQTSKYEKIKDKKYLLRGTTTYKLTYSFESEEELKSFDPTAFGAFLMIDNLFTEIFSQEVEGIKENSLNEGEQSIEALKKFNSKSSQPGSIALSIYKEVQLIIKNHMTSLVNTRNELLSELKFTKRYLAFLNDRIENPVEGDEVDNKGYMDLIEVYNKKLTTIQTELNENQSEMNSTKANLKILKEAVKELEDSNNSSNNSTIKTEKKVKHA